MGIEALFTSENLAIVVLAAWVVELKLSVLHYRKQAGMQWSIINKVVGSLNSVREVLKMTLDELE